MPKLNMKHVRETPNFNRYEVKLPNGRMWYIYLPKRLAPTVELYVGSYVPRDPQQRQTCACKGAHYHAPPRRPVTKRPKKRQTTNRKTR